MIFRMIDIYAEIINKLITICMYALLFSMSLQVAGRYIPFIPRYCK